MHEIDGTIIKALKKLEELNSERNRLESFIATYEEFHGRKINRDELLSEGSVSKTSHPKRRNNVAKLLDIAEKLIRDADRPLTRGEIADRMERDNVAVHATDIPKYIGTLLWRNKDRFEAVDEGYSLISSRDDHEGDLSHSPDARRSLDHQREVAPPIDEEALAREIAEINEMTCQREIDENNARIEAERVERLRKERVQRPQYVAKSDDDEIPF